MKMSTSPWVQIPLSMLAKTMVCLLTELFKEESKSMTLGTFYFVNIGFKMLLVGDLDTSGLILGIDAYSFAILACFP